MTKVQAYKTAFQLFLKTEITEELIEDYLLDEDGEATSRLQDFIVYNLKEEISWSTGIGIIDAVDTMYDEAKSNGNFKK